MEQCQIPILSHVLKLCNRKALFWEYYTEVFTGKGAWCLQVKEKKSKREREIELDYWNSLGQNEKDL